MGAVKNHFFDEINAAPEPEWEEPPVFTAGTTFDGRPAIYRRGTYLPGDVAERLLPLLSADRDLRPLAAQLKAAMIRTGALQ